MKLNLVFIAVLIILISRIVAAQETVVTQNFKQHQWGYTFSWDNHPGSYAGSPVLVVKFNRSVKRVDSRTIEVSLSYPSIPNEIIQTHKFVQYGSHLGCSLNKENIGFDIKNAVVKSFTDRFRHPQQLNEDSSLDDFLGVYRGDMICVVTIKSDKDLSSSEVDKTNWNKAVNGGIPDLRIVEREFVLKSFAPIAEPYIEFLKNNNVSFKTDDEFWFLASASIYKEATLAKKLKRSSVGFVTVWLTNLVAYIVKQVGNSDYEQEVRKFLGRDLEYKPNYEIEVDSDEVTYEI